MSQPAYKFDTECVRKRSNFSKADASFKFDADNLGDHPFDPEELSKAIPNRSPKLEELLKKIKKLDDADLKRDGHHYKHFIFCDVKSSNQGARMLASAFIANGYNLGYTAEPKPKPIPKNNKTAQKKKKIKRFNKIQLDSVDKLQKSKVDNFFLLSSTNVYDQPISVAMKKDMLAKFNERPANNHGKNVRFIIMDSGFKEGIDLFDIKYIHIFEPPVNMADQKQVVGRGTRTCGQSGLKFHPTQGWPLHVYIYDLEIHEKLQSSFLNSKSAFDLYLKSMNLDVKMMQLSSEIEELSVYGSVDYELNRPVHEFKTSNAITTTTTGGGGMPKEFIVTHKSMRQYVNSNFSDAKWTDVKMENLCESKQKGGSKVIQFTPTQRFVRDYFTPQCPVKGMLLWHSTGTGKTCSAIASATSSFDPQGYTILWVTRTTLKNDIWKNMFDQICNEQIRRMVADGITLPEAHSKRMRMLSKAWKIRPISYKQFSNLVSKENNYYEKLVSINGKEDPLRKTLLVIDEAHKLYGGGDLSSIERPDMNALHASLMNSYAVSGRDSVRVLLMTATPITENPMELIKLVNLCKPISNQIPDEFPVFANKYLTEDGSFSPRGKTQYLDDIAGHISYLTREKDARQFAQPNIERVKVQIAAYKQVQDMDKRYARFSILEESNEMKSLIEEYKKEIEQDYSDIDKSRFLVLKDVCDEYEGKVAKKCTTIANKNIRALVKELRGEITRIKNKIKDVRTTLKGKTGEKKVLLDQINANVLKDSNEYEKFKESVYFILKYKCGKKAPTDMNVNEFIKTHPLTLKHKENMEAFDDQIKKLDDEIQVMVDAFKLKVKQISKMLRSPSINSFEKLVVRTTIKDMRKEHKKELKEITSEVSENKKNITDFKKEDEQRFKSDMKLIKKDFKKHTKTLKKKQKADKKKAKKDLNNLRKTSKVREDFKEGIMKDLVDKYTDVVKVETQELEKEIERKREEKEKKEEEKRKEKERKAEEKREEKEKKEEEKRIAKEKKDKENREEKERKAKEKREEKERKAEETRKQREQKALNKTKKNLKP